MKLARTILGSWCGDFNHRHTEPKILGRQITTALRTNAALPGALPARVFAPTVEFTNRVVRLGEDDAPWADSIVIGTAHPADGGVADGIGTAVALTNADCPVICLRAGARLTLLHGGFRCLIREHADEENIIEAALRYFPNPKEISAWVGYGIGPCCWRPGYDTKPEIRDPARSRHADLLVASLSKTTEACPFGLGQVSVNLYTLARGLLQTAGIVKERIAVDARCTCCAVDANGVHPYWSHTRFRAEGGTDGCNLSVFWLERPPPSGV